MHTAYLVITLMFALMVSYSGVDKIWRDPIQVRVVHETVGVALKYFPLLAAYCGWLGCVARQMSPPLPQRFRKLHLGSSGFEWLRARPKHVHGV